MNVQELFAEVATAPVVKRAITNHSALNEAYDYGSAFSRGMRIDLNGLSILLISGTASIDDAGRTVHVGDFRAQLRRTFDNITKLLAAEGATWHDIVRTTCYLRDIERDYQAFNEERTAFLQGAGTRSAAGVHGHSGDSLPSRSSDRDRSDRHVPPGIVLRSSNRSVHAPCVHRRDRCRACRRRRGPRPPRPVRAARILRARPPSVRSSPTPARPKTCVRSRSSRLLITSTTRILSNTTAQPAISPIPI